MLIIFRRVKHSSHAILKEHGPGRLGEDAAAGALALVQGLEEVRGPGDAGLFEGGLG